MLIKKYLFTILFSIIIFNVSSQVFVDGGGSNSAPYSSWGTAANDIQAAINYANTNGIAEVWVAAGTYTRTGTNRYSLKNNVAIYGGFLVGHATIGQRDYTTNVTIISGNNTRQLFLNDRNGIDASAILDGFTLTQGNRPSAHGGAMYLREVSPTVSNCIFLGNTAPNARDGGAVYLRGASSATFTNCSFSSNTATDDGGAVYIFDAGCNPVFTDCTFNNNSCTDDGGGIYINNCDPTFTNCIVSNNLTVAQGGGIYVGGGSPSIHKCDIFGNTALQGGGVYANGGTIGLYTSIIRGNTATGDGGGICVNGSGGNFLNLTVYGNTANNGGGLATRSGDDPRFKSSIFWANSATTLGSQVFLEGTGSDPYFDYCTIGGGTAGFAGPGSGGSYAGGRFSNSISTDPLFVNEGGNDFHLTLITSPCIATGDPTTTGFNFPTDEDMDGEKRVRGVVDMGAYETNNAPTIVTSISVDNPGPEAVTMDEDGSPIAWSFPTNIWVTDPDDEDITWTILTQGANGVATATTPTSFNTSTPKQGNITYVPTADFNGTDFFIIEVTDGTFTDQIQINVTVNSISDPPSFTSIPVTTGKSGVVYIYNIIATDPDIPAEALTITCPTLPGWLTFTDFGNRTGLLTATPGDLDVGVHNVILEVSDGINPGVQQVFTITIADRILDVPAEYATIQLGVDAAVTGDKVLVAPGTYIENVVVDNKDIEIEGNASNPATVTIQGDGTDAVVTFINGGTTTMDGFTITNGAGRAGIPSVFTLHAPSSGRYGGGIFCYESSPTLNNLIISGNSLAKSGNFGGSGAAIYIGNVCTVTIGGSNTFITGNTSDTYRGGAICIDDSDVTIQGTGGGVNRVFITGNSAGNYGGGIAAYNSRLTLEDVSITGNSVSGPNGRGGGVYYHSTVVNSNGGVGISGNSAVVSGNNSQTSP